MKGDVIIETIEENELIELNPYISKESLIKLEVDDLIFVPIAWGDKSEPYIDIEVVEIIKLSRKSVKSISYSLSEGNYPKIRDQRSADIDLGILIGISIEIGLWIVSEIIAYIRHRKKKKQLSELNVKISYIHSTSKNKFRKFTYEGPDSKLETVIKSMQEFLGES